MNMSDQMAAHLMAASIDLARFESRERLKMLTRLRALERQLLAELRAIDPTEPSGLPFQRRRLDKLLAEVQGVIQTAYRGMATTLRGDLRELAVVEAAGVHALGAEFVVETLFSGLPSEATLKVMVKDLVIQGKPLHAWWGTQATTTFERYAETVRAGILRGDALQTIITTLRGTRAAMYRDGVFERTRRDVSTLVRTSLQAVANQARWETFRQNADVLRGVEWLTSLDAVVCVTYCVPLSGAAWDLSGRRLPGTTLAFPGPPPRHPNCRCVLLPLVREYRQLRTARGPRFQAQVDAVPAETKEQLDGGLGRDLSMPVWLRAQPDAVAKRMLGQTRYRMWAQGKLSLPSMVHAVTRKPLTLAQLKARRRRRAA